MGVHRGRRGDTRLEAVVRGRVQGVGFRWFTVTRATALGCTGWVANQPDGTVRVVAEADRGTLEQLLAELREGPDGARVEAVTATWGTATSAFAGFGVRSGGHAGD
ncbi:MAG TPA: acylphosphatase [Candidatus Limnocylindrales bacterium]|nr:acylphosphatase [Candidatus Limnocylindrales bacterium]